MSDTSEKFAAIDTKIIMLIAAGRTSFCAISTSCETLAKNFSTPRADSFRVVDRRLQSLRKRGLISYVKGKWLINGSSQ